MKYKDYNKKLRWIEKVTNWCPAQWEGQLENGKFVNIRYRGGVLKYGLTDDINDIRYDHEQTVGDQYDGVMDDAEMFERTGFWKKDLKIRGLIIAKDEIDILPTAISNAKRFVDDFVSIDNGSTDGTYEFLSDNSEVCIQDTTPFSERYFAQSFCDLASSKDVDWFLGMDADEIFPLQYEKIKLELEKLDPSINVVTVPMLYMFPFDKHPDGEPTFNDMVYWRSRLILKRFYRNCPQINPNAEHLIGYHCGKIPIDIKDQKVHDLGFKWFVRHYQFREYERAARKLESYLVNDNERNQGYEYMKEVVKALKTEDYSAFTFKHISEFMAEEEKMMAEAKKWRENKTFQELGL